MSKLRNEYGRMQLVIDPDCDTTWLLLENVNRDGDHWLTIAHPNNFASPIGYLRLRPVATGSHTFEVAEVRAATGPLLGSSVASSGLKAPVRAGSE